MSTETTQDKLKRIKQSFRLLMNGEASRYMRENGLGYHLNWGVSTTYGRWQRNMAKTITSPSHCGKRIFANVRF